MERSPGFRDIVGRVDARASGIVVMELPVGDLTVLAHSAGDFDDPGRAEVRPGELLRAGPDELDRLARGLGEAGRFDGGLAGVLAAVSGTGIGRDHADLSLGHA